MALRTVLGLWPLFFGLSLLGLAGGIQTTLIGFRAQIEGFADLQLGLLVSAYYGGFLIGSLVAPRFVETVGHIRTFAAVTALASMTILIHASIVEPWTWAAMRFLTGLAFSSIYVVAEGWLNRATESDTRGSVFSIYMSILLGGLCLGQFLLDLADPAEYPLFVMISILVSGAAIPILMKRLDTPEIDQSARVSLKHLWQRAKLGFVGLILIQSGTAILAGLTPVYLAKVGFDVGTVSLFMGSMMGGGMALQWPLGRLSDAIDRRWVLAGSSLIAVAAALGAMQLEPGPELYACAFLLGGCAFSQYSLIVALIHDHLKPEEIIPATGTIILLCGLVAIVAPLGVSLAWEFLSLQAFYPMVAFLLGVMGLLSVWRVLTVPALPPEYKTQSTIQSGVTPVGNVLQGDAKIDAALSDSDGAETPPAAGDLAEPDEDEAPKAPTD
jgi:MFS family permease